MDFSCFFFIPLKIQVEMSGFSLSIEVKGNTKFFLTGRFLYSKAEEIWIYKIG